MAMSLRASMETIRLLLTEAVLPERAGPGGLLPTESVAARNIRILTDISEVVANAQSQTVFTQSLRSKAL